MALDHPPIVSTVAGSSPDSEQPAKGGIRSIPGFVWLATATLLILALLGSLLLPLLRIPDEKHNADMVLMAQEGDWLEEGWPGLDERRIDPAIIAASLSLGPRERALRENRAGSHPPLFFLTAAVTSSLATLAVDDPDLELRLWTYRLVSVIMTALLPITYYLVAAELTTNRWARLSSALIPLVIPGITLRDASMVNTDAMLMVFSSLSVLMGIRVAKGDLSLKSAVFLGVSTGLAALTKGHGLFLLPVLLIAYLIPAIRDRRVTGQWLASAAVSGAITLLVGGWWWIRNLVLYGAIQPVRAPSPAEGVLTLDFIDWLTEASRRLVGSFWGGGFALAGRPFLPLFWILTVLLVVACIVGWLRSTDRVASSVSALYAVVLVVSVLLSSATLSWERGRVVAVQGRYLFPGLAGLAPLIGLAAVVVARRVSRWLPALFVGGSLAMNLLAIDYMLDRYWGSIGSGLADQWAAVVATAPVTEGVSTAILVLSAASFLILLVSAILLGMRGEATDANQVAGRHIANVGRIESEQTT